MMEAVMYGIIPRANTPALEKAPPTNISNNPSRLFELGVILSSALASTPGNVM
jgi:hypothetical protein